MKRIKLTQGKFALVDDEDFDYLNSFKWCAAFDGSNFYALRGETHKDEKQYNVLMHRVILPKKHGYVRDHINGNSLDNRRCNLRYCTQSENSRNRRKSKNNTSGVTGVYWNKSNKSWEVRINANKKETHIGYYKDFNKAVKVRKEAEKKYYGKFARKVNTKDYLRRSNYDKRESRKMQ